MIYYPADSWLISAVAVSAEDSSHFRKFFLIFLELIFFFGLPACLGIFYFILVIFFYTFFVATILEIAALAILRAILIFKDLCYCLYF